MAASVCSHRRFGYCKYKENCRYLHIEELCKVQGCSSASCLSRHPRCCRYFYLFGTCKFRDKCAYSHETPLQDTISAIKRKLNDVTKRLDDMVQAIANLKYCMDTRISTPPPPAASVESLPEPVSHSNIPQLDGEDSMLDDETPPLLNMDNDELPDFGLSGEDMVKLDEYLCVDPSPSFQTLSNIACGFKIPIIKVQKYVEWKQSREKTSTMF